MPIARTIFWDVDTQVDFMLPGGKLYVPGAEKIIPNLRCLVDAVRQGRAFLVSSADAHAPDDEEFNEWPPHCLRGTPGQQKIPETLTHNCYVVPNQPIALPDDLGSYQQLILEKQKLDVFTNPNTETLLDRLCGSRLQPRHKEAPPSGASAPGAAPGGRSFSSDIEEPEKPRALAPEGAPEFVLFGVVTEYCVRCAALGLLERGQRVAIVTDAIETLDPAVGRRTLDALTARGARLIITNEALALV